jgi:hypothetical protein
MMLHLLKSASTESIIHIVISQHFILLFLLGIKCIFERRRARLPFYYLPMINATPTTAPINVPNVLLQVEAPDDVEKSNGLPPPLTPPESLPSFVEAAFAVDVVDVDVSVVLVSVFSELVNVIRVVVSLALEDLVVVSLCAVSVVVEVSAALVLVDSAGGGVEELAAGAGAAAVVESPVSNPHSHLSASPMKKCPITVPPPASCPAQAADILVVN